MSAYGDIKKSLRSGDPLPATCWSTDSGTQSSNETKLQANVITIHHLTLQTAQQHNGLVDYMQTIFTAVVEEGMTYPQEGQLTKDSFLSYFFSADVFLGMATPSQEVGEVIDGAPATGNMLDVASAQDWKKSVAGFYYVKPNYPGRSSHICNGGFVVPPVMRGRRYGRALGKSFLHYAPKLGYQASVFNLVYVNNTASVRIWDSLGFSRAGRIPSAGRLKKKDDAGEEFVDALVFYKRFSE